MVSVCIFTKHQFILLFKTLVNLPYPVGGDTPGSIQSNIATGRYSAIIIKRTVDIFDYYDNVSKD